MKIIAEYSRFLCFLMTSRQGPPSTMRLARRYHTIHSPYRVASAFISRRFSAYESRTGLLSEIIRL